MANVKNFGLIGVSDVVQFGKGGAKVTQTGGAFALKAADGTTNTSLNLSALTASTTVSATGNISSTGGSVSANTSVSAGTSITAGTDITATTGNILATAGTVTGGTGVIATTGGVTATAGNLTATAGNLVLTATTGTVTIGTDSTLSRAAAGVLKANGTGAFMVPVGSTLQQPEGQTGMVRVNNTSTPAVEFYNGTEWTTLSDASAVSNLQTEVNAIETALGSAYDTTTDTFDAGAFTGGALDAPTSFTSAIQQVADFAAAHDTLDEILPGTAGQVIYNNAGTWTAAATGATSGVQGYDAGLAALAAKSSTGILVQTGDDTYASRSLTAPAAGITISNSDGVSGSPTFALANDLAGLEGLTTTGYSVRTGDGTWTTRSMSVVSGDLVITGAADGVSTDTTFGLATVTQADSGDFVKVTLDSKGRVTGNTAVTTADITALVDGEYVNIAGDTMTGALNMGNNLISGVASPESATDAATKGYVDSLAGGLTWQAPVDSVGTTLPATATTGDRFLNTSDNKVYTATGTNTWNAGVSPADGWALFDTTDETGYVFNGTSWVQFTGTGQITAGIGLSKDGNVLNVNLGAGIAELPSDEIGIDVASGLALQLTSTATDGQLTFVLDTGSGLSQSSSGLKIAASGVTNSMLANSGVTVNGDTGTGTLSLGGTLEVKGTSVQGISTSVDGSGTFTVTAADASSSQKGVATFNTASFAVTSGDVTIKSAGVSNTQLANSSISFATDDENSGAISLGNTLTISGDGVITTSYSGSTVDIALSGTVAIANGGTGLTSAPTAGQLLIGATGGTYSQATLTAGTGVSISSTSGAITISADTTALVSSFSGGTTGLTPNTPTNGDIVLDGTLVAANGGTGINSYAAGDMIYASGTSTLSKLTKGTAGTVLKGGDTPSWAAVDLTADVTGTLPVGNGGTGAVSFTAGQILIGNGTSAIAVDADLAFDATTNELTVGTATLTGTAAGDAVLESATGDVVLVPATGGQVVVGPLGASATISADAGETLTLTGNDTLVLSSTSGDIQMSVVTGAKIDVTGVTADAYATSLQDTNLVNKKYVDTAIASGAAAGAVKAFQAVVSLTGSAVTLGTMPAGATVLRVKVVVTAADSSTGTLVVGKSGTTNAYMTAAENDVQETGIYLAETFTTESGAVAILATPSGAAAGSATVIVEYQVAQ